MPGKISQLYDRYQNYIDFSGWLVYGQFAEIFDIHIEKGEGRIHWNSKLHQVNCNQISRDENASPDKK